MQFEGTENSKQEWSFTLYDFDGHGRITKEVSTPFLLSSLSLTYQSKSGRELSKTFRIVTISSHGC